MIDEGARSVEIFEVNVLGGRWMKDEWLHVERYLQRILLLFMPLEDEKRGLGVCMRVKLTPVVKHQQSQAEGANSLVPKTVRSACSRKSIYAKPSLMSYT